jgi:hypothetical protein
MEQWGKASFLQKYICLGIREIVQIWGGLPLDKKIPEMGIEELPIELRSIGRARVPVPTRAVPPPHAFIRAANLLWEFEGYEFGWLCAGVG